MTWAEWEQALLALMMWREARNQGETGMRATGCVAWNRHIDSRAPLGELITADAQFTSINPYKKTYDPQLDMWPTAADYQFATALRIAIEITSGTSEDPTNGALFYRNASTATNQWFQREIVDSGKYRLSARIGAHEFYARRTAFMPNPPELMGEA